MGPGSFEFDQAIGMDEAIRILTQPSWSAATKETQLKLSLVGGTGMILQSVCKVFFDAKNNPSIQGLPKE